MRPVTFFCTVLLALFGVGNPAVVVAQDPAQAQWFSIAAAEGKSVAWSRWAVDGSGSVPQAATLSIASDSRCSLLPLIQLCTCTRPYPCAVSAGRTLTETTSDHHLYS